MVETYPYSINNECFQLHPLKCLSWENEGILILSDTHIGKTSHFRKNGISISIELITAELENLSNAINAFKPKKIIVVGDLFHSHMNNEIAIFECWIKDYQTIEWHLVKGNHDILPDEVYNNLWLRVHHQLPIKNIVFTHELPKNIDASSYYITGHIHPAIKVNIGKTKQKLLPCFYFGQQHAILPSFGLFTGNFTIKPLKNDSVFAVTPNAVLKI